MKMQNDGSITTDASTPRYAAMTPDEQTVERQVNDLCTQIKRHSGRSVSLDDIAAVLLTQEALAQPKVGDGEGECE